MIEEIDRVRQAAGRRDLRFITRELSKIIRESVMIPRTAKESVRVNPRVMVKPILRKYSGPPDKQEKATQRYPP